MTDVQAQSPSRFLLAGAILGMVLLIALSLSEADLILKPLWHVGTFTLVTASVLGIAVRGSRRRVGLVPSHAWIVIAVVVGGGIGLELAQRLFLGAELEKSDMAFDVLGCAVGSGLWLGIRAVMNRQNDHQGSTACESCPFERTKGS